MQIERVQTDAIEVPKRLRSVDADRVKALADSIDAIGLRQPITVWSQAGDQLDLVAGAHRLEAALFLGWEWIDAIFLDGSDIDRQLWEIDENLMRSELTATQQAEHLAKRKELWAVKESGNSVPTLTGRGNKQFAAETAEATGVSKRNVNRATSRAAMPKWLQNIDLKLAMNPRFMYYFQEAKTRRTLSWRPPRAKQDAGPNRHFAKQDAGGMAATISKIHSGESRP